MPELGGVPFAVFGADELAQARPVQAGDLIDCAVPDCGQRHVLEGTTTTTGEPGMLLLYRCCGDGLYLGGVAGREV